MEATPPDDLLGLVGEIYEASYRPQKWKDVFVTLCQMTGAQSGGLVMENKQQRTRSIIASHNLPGLPKFAYRLGLGKHDVIFKIQASRPVGRAELVARHEEIRVSNPHYYRLFMKPNDMGYIAAVNLFNDENIHSGIGLHRSFQSEPFGEGELRLLDELTPHLQRALRIQTVLLRGKSRVATLQSALSRIMLGVVVLGHDNKVIYRNPVAEALMTTHPSLFLASGKLRAHQMEESTRLLKLIDDVRRDGGANNHAIGLSHPERDHPLTVIVAGLAKAPRLTPRIPAPGEVVLYLTDPDSSFSAPKDHLMTVFKLSPGEAGVAIALANGLSLNDIHEQRGVSKETVRSQLNGIFSKLGVNKQQDVIRLLLSSGLHCLDASGPD